MEEVTGIMFIQGYRRVCILRGLISSKHPLILLSLRYTYEVCLFGDATQKSGAHHSLGYVAFASIHEQALTGFQQIFVVEYRP